MKTLNAKNKTRDQAKNQIKRWFARNPNRKVIEVELTTGLIQVTRENYIK